MKTPAIEPLESRIAPATLLALNDSDQLLRFNSATPGTIAATVAIGGLGATEDVVGIDFRPATGLLFGLGLDGTTARLLTIDPVTGATAQIGATFTVSGTSFGFDFNPVADRLRLVSDTDINLSINPADGVVTTQTTLNPGTPNVVGAAYTNPFPGATTTTLYAIDSGTDVLATITPPASGTLTTVGALGVDTSDVVGFDLGHGKGEAFAALRVGVSSQLHTINLTNGAATLVGTIDTTNTPNIRGLAVVLHTWQGDAGTGAWSNGANWAAGFAPGAGDAVLFPAGATTFSVFQNLPVDTAFNSLRFTGAGYDISGNRMKLEGGVTAHAAGMNKVGLLDLRGASAGVDFIKVENAASELSFTILNVDADLGDGLEFSGAGIVRTSTLTAFGSAVPIVVNGPELISEAGYTAPGGTKLQAGFITVNGGFSAVTLEGGTLRGRGFTGAVTGTGGSIFSSAESLEVNGALTLNPGATATFNMPLDTPLDPLRVNGAVSLGNAPLAVTLNGNLPARITLLLNDGADAITGTFATLAEGATVVAGGQNYAISYTGGDGNDIVLTKQGGPAPTIAGNTATYVDVDGDDVTVKFSGGTISADHFILRDAGGGRAQLEMIDLMADPGFTGASITLTAKPSANGGDGSANVGFIDALGLDLGSVSIAGDLGAIDAGNGADNVAALKALTVQSLGASGFGTGAPDLRSDLDGRLEKLTVRGDVRGARVFVFDSVVTPGGQDFDASIGTVLIGGSVAGGAVPFSGRIDAAQNIGKVTIKGDLRGGAGNNSGIVEAGGALTTFELTGSLAGGAGTGSGAVVSDGPAKSFKIGRDVVGGMGDDSALISAEDGLGSLTIAGSLVGGAGDDSGRIDVSETLGKLTIGGSVVGGTGIASAKILLDRGDAITIAGSLIGRAEDSAFIDIGENVGSLTIGGSVLGGAGENSAFIESGSDPIGTLKIGGAMIGGAGADSAVIDTAGDIKSLSIGGSVQGGGGDGSAVIGANNITSLTIGGSFAGGAGAGSAEIEVDAVGALKIGGDFAGGSGADSGVLDADSVATLSIARSIFTGAGAGSGRFAIQGDLGALSVGGSIVGTAANRFFLLVGSDAATPGAPDVVLGKLTVAGSVQHSLILAGFDTVPSGRNADAQIGSVTVGGDWIASSISAGVQDDADSTLNAFFGEADDQIIAGIGTTNQATLKSKIGSITIKGQLLGTVAGGDSFGFVAEEIGSVKVGAFSEPLTAAVDAQPLGATGDFVAREDVVGLNVPLPVFAGAAGVNVISTTLATFVDVDGDLVTIKSSKPILDQLDFTSIVSGSGNQLQLIDFTNDGPLGSGVNLTITAAPQDVNADGKKDGDGFVNIGRIAAAGLDLGAISITGDLGQLDAGDLTTLNSPAVKSLTVQSMGEFGTSTQGGGDLVSSITGAVGGLTVKGNLRDTQINLTAATVAHATISKVTLGGSLIGGAGVDSGNIFATGDIGSVTIGGSIIGGTGDHSALLRANGTMGKATIAGSIIGGGDNTPLNRDAGRLSSGGDMGEVKITGDVRGGPGELSGTIFAGGKLKSLTIGGSLVGGDGDHDTVVGQEGQIHSGGDMGKVTITREIVGGGGDRSAQILSVAKIASVKVGGVVKGGAGEDSGAINAGATLDAVEIKGDLLGGDGISSGRVEAVGAVKKFTLTGSILGGGAGNSGHVVGASFEMAKIGGNIVGAADFGTGFFESNGALKSITVGGSILGGTGIDTGQIEAVGDIGSAKIAGDIRGGDATGVLVLFCSGFVASDGRIGSITVGGSLVSGTDTSTGTCTNNGAIAAGNDIGSLTVKGSLIGNSTRSVVISARGQALPTATTDLAIGKLDIGGQVEFAQILAGYDNNGTQPVESNADAQIGSVKVTGDWIASSLVAGVKNRGADNVDDLGFDDDNIDFGNARDQKIAEAADTITSKIASITIKGQALGTFGGLDHFGFVAQEIGALKIGTVKYPLIAGPASAADITGYALGATGDLRVQEVAL